MTPTLSWCFDCFVTSVAQGQEQRLRTLEQDVDQWEEKHWANDRRRKGHFQDGSAQLNVLAPGLHGDGPTASAKR